MPEILLRVPWKHQTHIVSKCKTIQEAIFYLNQVIEGNISRSELEHIIDANLYYRWVLLIPTYSMCEQSHLALHLKRHVVTIDRYLSQREG